MIKERYDPDFTRTFGVMTKMNLDFCYKTTDVNYKDRAESVMKILSNEKNSPFSFPTYGWVGITGQNPKEMITESVQQTRDKERAFFDGPEFMLAAGGDHIARLPRDSDGRWPLGTDILRERIGKALKENIKKRLPKILGVLEKQVRKTKALLEALGEPPPTSRADRLAYLREEVLRPWREDALGQIYRDNSTLWSALQLAFSNSAPSSVKDYSILSGYPPSCSASWNGYDASMECRNALFASKASSITNMAGIVFDTGGRKLMEISQNSFIEVGRQH